MNIGKNVDGLLNGSNAFLSPQEILSKCKNYNGGSNGSLIVNVTWTNSTHATLDKNYTEILSAIKKGIMPIFITDSDDVIVNYHLINIGYNSESQWPYTLMLGNFTVENNKTLVYYFNAETETAVLTYDGGST